MSSCVDRFFFFIPTLFKGLAKFVHFIRQLSLLFLTHFQSHPPKYRRKRLYGVVKRELGKVFHRLAGQKGCRIEEGHMMADHVHMLISIPPKYAVSSVIGYR